MAGDKRKPAIPEDWARDWFLLERVSVRSPRDAAFTKDVLRDALGWLASYYAGSADRVSLSLGEPPAAAAAAAYDGRGYAAGLKGDSTNVDNVMQAIDGGGRWLRAYDVSQRARGRSHSGPDDGAQADVPGPPRPR